MGERPEGMTLSRIDNNGDYEPSNCEWTDAKEQALNRRSTHWVEYNGERLSLKDFSKKYLTCGANNVHNRLAQGWSMKQIINHYLKKEENDVSLG
jgi:hypothetical protein